MSRALQHYFGAVAPWFAGAGTLIGGSVGVGLGVGAACRLDPRNGSIVLVQTMARHVAVSAAVGAVMGYTAPVSLPLLLLTPRRVLVDARRRMSGKNGSGERQ